MPRLACVLLFMACSPDGTESTDGGITGPGPTQGGGDEPIAAMGQVMAPWDSGYCLATFTEDVDLLGRSGNYIFSIAEGDSFLMGSFAQGALPAEIVLMLPEGSIGLDLHDDPPYTDNCVGQDVTADVVAFHDVDVYGDEGLSTLLCTVPANTVVDKYQTFSLVSSSSDGSIYRWELDGLAAHCDGVVEGYTHSNSFKIGYTTYGVLPFSQIYRPQ